MKMQINNDLGDPKRVAKMVNAAGWSRRQLEVAGASEIGVDFIVSGQPQDDLYVWPWEKIPDEIGPILDIGKKLYAYFRETQNGFQIGYWNAPDDSEFLKGEINV